MRPEKMFTDPMENVPSRGRPDGTHVKCSSHMGDLVAHWMGNPTLFEISNFTILKKFSSHELCFSFLFFHRHTNNKHPAKQTAASYYDRH